MTKSQFVPQFVSQHSQIWLCCQYFNTWTARQYRSIFLFVQWAWEHY